MMNRNGFKWVWLLLTVVPAISFATVMKDIVPQAFSVWTNWQGYYAGLNVGGAFNSGHGNTTTVFASPGYFDSADPAAIAAVGSQSLSSRGFIGGVQGGYNYQIRDFIIGLEMDFGAMNINKSRTSSGVYPCCSPTGFTVKQSVRTHWLFTLRPRLGYALGDFLFYGTLGYALTDMNYRSTFTDTFASAHESGGVKKNVNGWAAGLGLEYQITRHWSLRGEYLYMNFNHELSRSQNLVTGTPPVGSPSNVFTHKISFRAQTANFAVNYRF